jgi:hypothetical protein
MLQNAPALERGHGTLGRGERHAHARGRVLRSHERVLRERIDKEQRDRRGFVGEPYARR